MNYVSPLANISPLADIESSVRGSTLKIYERVSVDSFVKIKFAGGTGDVVIGAGSQLNSGVVIYSGNGVILEEGVLVGANTTFAPTNHAYQKKDKTVLEQRFLPSKGGILIEDDCWIGAGCVLLDGVILRRGCVVAAGSVVRGEWPAYSVLAGNPLRVIGARD